MKTRVHFALLAAAVSLAAIMNALAASETPVVRVPRFTHPGAGQLFYFVLTDRFANGSNANDTGGITGGPSDHGFDPLRISHFQGGDFSGLTQRLDYLQDLGVTAIWVTPPFENKPVQQGTAGYHGYWTLDFLEIDPHFGTNTEYREFIAQAHARGMRVFMDIIVNHTADVIQLEGDYKYRPEADTPFRTAAGEPFDVRAVAYNGLGDTTGFPTLSPQISFPYRPTVPPGEKEAKKPGWLNDPIYYHNRGDTTFAGENSIYGDFVGLDDTFTEHPRVVDGFIDIFSHWLEEYGVDGFRIDTARHVNTEFWQAFIPAIRAKARDLGRPDFLQFGEVYNEAGDPAVLSEFSTNTIPIDTTLDFGFFAAARTFVSQGGTASALVDFFARDDYYIDHDSNVHSTTTFLGNHDAGRFGYFLQEDNPGASRELLADLVKLGHGLLFLSRGQPVVYYGDEQGMIGRGGNDMQARETMFAARAPDFRGAALLASDRTGADDKFDQQHPFYELFSRLAALRAAHPALRTGAMLPRPTAEPGLFAFSRVERDELIEYLVATNNSRTTTLSATVPTSQPAGTALEPIFSSAGIAADEANPALPADSNGEVMITLGPLQFAVWRATAALPPSTSPPTIAWATPSTNALLTFTTKEVDGLIFPSRRELRAEVAGGDGVAEVTFALQRASRSGQSEIVGVDDSPPYRVFWNPPSDLEDGDDLTFVASVDNLRGHRSAAQISGLTIALSAIDFGIKGASVPTITGRSGTPLVASASRPARLHIEAIGTPPLEYQWIKDGTELSGATDAVLEVTEAGNYSVLIRNRAGTVVSGQTIVRRRQ